MELGESYFAKYVHHWREELAAENAVEAGYTAMLDAISTRQAARANVAVDDWLAPPTSASSKLFERAQKHLDAIDRDGYAALWDEPHTLGWFHQHFGLTERAESNRAHTQHEAKHQTQTTTTRLYTPRWIADFLAEHCLDECNPTDPTPTICDPAVGGGQMLLAAFDALIRRGVDPKDALGQLHGVDLDPRAVEITHRSLALDAARCLGHRDLDAEKHLRTQLHVADGLFDDAVFKHANFDIVLANPPYMGSRSMPAALKKRLADEFKPFHADLYTAFIRRCHALSSHAVGILAQQTIWYLSRFQRARAWLLDHADLVEFMHLGAGAFENLSGEKASVVAFVQVKRPAPIDATPRPIRQTRFIDLRDAKGARKKRESYRDRSAWHPDKRVQTGLTTDFDTLPGRPLAHWLSPRLRRHFDTDRRLADIADIPGRQNKTGRNREFIRKWHEVAPNELRRAPEITGEHGSDDGRWVFYSKGGPHAPWWGNWQHVIDWSPDARRFYRENRTSSLLDEKWWFKEGICYTDFGGRRFNARWMPPGCLFDMTGPAIFPHDPRPDHRLAVLAVLNARPVRELLNAMNPSLHYQVRDLRNLPLPEWPADLERELAHHARQLVEGCRLAATLDPTTPESLRHNPADTDPTDQLAEFTAQRPHLEAQLNRLVCELYECPDLAED